MKYIFKNIIPLLLTYCLLSGPTYAQISSEKYSLKQLLQLARENNRDMQLLYLNLQKNNEDLEIKKSGFRPRIDAFANYQWYWGNIPEYIFPAAEGSILSGGTSDGFYPVALGLPNNLLTGVSVSQRIFEFAYLSAGKSREALQNVEKSQIRRNTEDLYFEVAWNYFGIAQLQAKQEFLDFNISRLDQMLRIVQLQIKNQMADSLQLLELDLKKTELELNRSELKSGIHRKTGYLKMLVGLPDSVNLEPEGSEYSPIENIDQYKTSENTELDLLNHAQSLNELAQKQIQSEYLPTLDLKVNLLWNAQSENLAFFSNDAFGNHISTLGLNLDIPIYHGDEKKRKLNKIEIDQQILELQKQKLAAGYQLQNTNFLEELHFKRELYFHQQKLTKIKDQYFKRSELQYKKGVLAIKDLLDAQSSLLDSQMKEMEMQLEVKLAELNYFKWSNQLLSRYEE